MDMHSAIQQLEKEWELNTGFFGRLRYGSFDPAGLERVIRILEAITDETKDAKLLDRRLVELLWFVPRFMSWQRERVQEQGGDVQELDNATDALEALLQRILGVP